MDSHLRATAERRAHLRSRRWIGIQQPVRLGNRGCRGAVNTLPPVDVAILPWANGNWNSNRSGAGHYPVRVGDPNTLNARVYAIGGAASGVTVTLRDYALGLGRALALAGVTTITIPYNGSAVATIRSRRGPQHAGHKCVRVRAAYASDTNPATTRIGEHRRRAGAGWSGGRARCDDAGPTLCVP